MDWDFLHHKIAWAAVERMIIDAPNIEDEEVDGKGEEIKLTSENADAVLEMINRINR